MDLRALLGWEARPGQSTTLPGPQLAFQDPDTGQGDSYVVPDKAVSAAWPLEVSANVPLEWESGVESTIPVTLTNIASSVTARGILTGTVEGVDGTVLWSKTYPLDISPRETQVVLNLQRYFFRDRPSVGWCVFDGTDRQRNSASE